MAVIYCKNINEFCFELFIRCAKSSPSEIICKDGNVNHIFYIGFTFRYDYGPPDDWICIPLERVKDHSLSSATKRIFLCSVMNSAINKKSDDNKPGPKVLDTPHLDKKVGELEAPTMNEHIDDYGAYGLIDLSENN